MLNDPFGSYFNQIPGHILSTLYMPCPKFQKKKSCSDLLTWRGVACGELCVAQERKPAQKGCFIGDEVARPSVMLRGG